MTEEEMIGLIKVFVDAAWKNLQSYLLKIGDEKNLSPEQMHQLAISTGISFLATIIINTTKPMEDTLNIKINMTKFLDKVHETLKARLLMH